MKYKHIKLLHEVSLKDKEVVGGKGASLGEMCKSQQIFVPEGFVITVNAFETFLNESKLKSKIKSVLSDADLINMESIKEASKLIMQDIQTEDMPKSLLTEINVSFKNLEMEYVAVRSSAISEDSAETSWAGELESFLNTSEINLLDNIKRCWASLFSPRALIYQMNNKIDIQQMEIAVVIQKMVQSDISGICFTANPVNRNFDELIIEASYGLGEAIVSGSLTPDMYLVKKSSRRILTKNVITQEEMIVKGDATHTQTILVRHELQKKQKLEDKIIIELADLCCQIEQYYKFPQDIEWAYHNNQINILQSRPITTL